MSLHLPPSWPRMSDHARACYLVDSHQAKDYSRARRAVGREKLRRTASAPITVAAYQQGLERLKIS